MSQLLTLQTKYIRDFFFSLASPKQTNRLDTRWQFKTLAAYLDYELEGKNTIDEILPVIKSLFRITPYGYIGKPSSINSSFLNNIKGLVFAPKDPRDLNLPTAHYGGPGENLCFCRSVIAAMFGPTQFYIEIAKFNDLDALTFDTKVLKEAEDYFTSYSKFEEFVLDVSNLKINPDFDEDQRKKLIKTKNRRYNRIRPLFESMILNIYSGNSEANRQKATDELRAITKGIHYKIGEQNDADSYFASLISALNCDVYVYPFVIQEDEHKRAVDETLKSKRHIFTFQKIELAAFQGATPLTTLLLQYFSESIDSFDVPKKYTNEYGIEVTIPEIIDSTKTREIIRLPEVFPILIVRTYQKSPGVNEITSHVMECSFSVPITFTAYGIDYSYEIISAVLFTGSTSGGHYRAVFRYGNSVVVFNDLIQDGIEAVYSTLNLFETSSHATEIKRNSRILFVRRITKP
jgi:hypothetical protein